MIKKTVTILSVVALATATTALPVAATGITADTPVQIPVCCPLNVQSLDRPRTPPSRSLRLPVRPAIYSLSLKADSGTYHD